MATWFSILIAGVLINNMDMPMSKYHLAFTDAKGKLIRVITDKDGKFQVDLAPGTYRLQFGLCDQLGLYDYYPLLEQADKITVYENMYPLRLKEPQPLPVVEAPKPPVVIQGDSDYSLRLGPRA